MANIITRETAGTNCTVNNAPLSYSQMDDDLIALNNDIITLQGYYTTGVSKVLNGGTGVTTKTGTGSVVLNTSPALVTPSLGTPASGNLTNCTFPTLNQNTSGSAASLSATLPVNRGGSGVTTSTGTGSVVLNTSPTFITPALGTPSSGNISNCSGTASININGTVGATARYAGRFSVVTSDSTTTGYGNLNMNSTVGEHMGAFVCRATGIGDGNMAGMSFWNDLYAIKLGVRDDGTFGFGGWSRPAWSWYSDAAGNIWQGGSLTIDGQTIKNIMVERNTTANTAGVNLNIYSGGAAVAATNKAGGVVQLVPGTSTGIAESGVNIYGNGGTVSGTADGTTKIVIQTLDNKLGFYGATPVARQAATTAAVAAPPASAGTFGWGSAADKNTAVAAINNLMTRVAQLENILYNIGITL